MRRKGRRMMDMLDRTRNAKDMDGLLIRAGDKVVCMSLPKSQPCLSRIVGVDKDGMVLVTNGRIRRSVDPASCILQTAT